MRRSSTAALAAPAALAFLLAGCAGTTSGDSAASGGTAGGDAPAAAGWDPATKTIKVGALYPTSGPFANTIQDIIGMRAYFERATSDGGPLEGYTIEVESADTQYDVTRAIPQYQQMKDDVAIFGTLGGFIAEALPLVADDKVTVTPVVDKFDSPNILPVYPTFEIFAANSVAYAAEQEGGKDGVYCALLQDGAIGDQTDFGVKYATDELGLNYAASASFPTANPSDLTAQVVTLKDAGCTEIMVGGVFVMQQAAARAAQLGWEPHWTALGITYVSDIATGTAADYIQKNVSFVWTGSDWTDETVEGAANMAEDVEKVEPGSPPALVTYETGYASAITMTAVLRKALDNGDMSPAGIVQASNEIGEVDMFGLAGGPTDYGTGPDDRKAPREVTFFEVTDETDQGVRAIERNYTSEVGDSVGFFRQD
jgi:ABC-type branched-subunit amino acid transport system substrate-binding protein